MAHEQKTFVSAPHGDLLHARAAWLAPDTIAWDVPTYPGTEYTLWADPNGGLGLEPAGVHGGSDVRSWPLSHAPAGLPDALRARFPHWAHRPVFRVPASAGAVAFQILRGQLAVCAVNGDNRVATTSLQLQGVLDTLYANDLPMGPVFAKDRVALRVWAPTARSVTLHLYDGPAALAGQTLPMMLEAATGTWSHTGSRAQLEGKYYLYEVEVYVRATGKVERNLVTDPYAVALSANSKRSQIVALDDPELAPAGWREMQKPPLASRQDITLYELHVRDFSAHDPSVPPALRGTFAAFTWEQSHGMRHLAQLARCGLSHVHLLPTYDFVTVNDDKSAWRSPPFEQLAALPPDSEEQQRRVMADADADGFNWGYDPFHYNVPEGSYATDPDGPVRTLEYRQMVLALNRLGLRVVMDVVYNHTFAGGQSPLAVLDRIVPGYYHRLDAQGNTLSESCCPDTAPEHTMVTKLIVDSVLLWARQYRLDGFRFDIMGLHMKSTMLQVRAALDALTLEADGVDGKSIYIYGEGWNFGAVANDARGPNATQANLAGTGIGTFSDRMRDAVRGGGHGHPRRNQGFGTGLYLEPNGTFQGSREDERAGLLHVSDLVRLGMAGHLADFELVDRHGQRVKGSQIDYYGQHAGYARRPDDAVAYVSCHDDATWFDTVNVKAPHSLALADRVRMHNLGISIVALSQGIPFFHAGDEILRSKSADKNSYSSGDWFNRLDFTRQTHNWGIGLPPQRDNGADWPMLKPLLADPRLKPGPAEMEAALQHFQEMLRVRASSGLFRLASAEQIRSAVSFFNVGPDQIPGLVALRIAAEGVPGPYTQAVVLINVRPDATAVVSEGLAGAPLQLHPVLRDSHDPVVRGAAFDARTGRFAIPPRTAAVFVV